MGGFGKAAGKGAAAAAIAAMASPYGKGPAAAAGWAAGGKAGGKGKGDPQCKVYVGSLSYKTTWRDLKDHFATVGTVTYANVLVFQETKGKGCANKDGWSKGTGIVEFSNAQEAAMAITSLNNSMLDGRQIFVDPWDATGASRSKGSNPAETSAKGTVLKGAFGVPKGGWPQPAWGKGKAWGGKDMKKANPEAKIFVDHLAYKTTWEGLKAHMGQAGTVVYAKINEEFGKGGFKGANGQGWSKGNGLVEYSSAAEAQNAIILLNGSELDGRKITVDMWGSGGKGGN